jgi:hypothetical protein
MAHRHLRTLATAGIARVEGEGRLYLRLAGDLLKEGIPACAITTIDDLDVIDIASTAHLQLAA